MTHKLLMHFELGDIAVSHIETGHLDDPWFEESVVLHCRELLKELRAAVQDR